MPTISMPLTRRYIIATASIFAVALAGCNANQPIDAGAQQGVPATPSKIAAERLVGRWGVAAYHQDSARQRTEVEARRQCSNPYTIKAGQNGGVMMHLADQSEAAPAAQPTSDPPEWLRLLPTVKLSQFRTILSPSNGSALTIRAATAQWSTFAAHNMKS